MNKNALRSFLAGALLALVLGAPLLAGGIFSRAQASASSPNLPIYATSPLVIPGAAFSSDGYDPPSMFFSFWGGYMRGGNVNTCVKAPVYAPQGASLTAIYASAYDNDPAAGMWLRLYRVQNYTGTVDEMAYVGTTSEGDFIQVLGDTVDDPFVSYPTYSYYVGACLESNATRLYSVRIYYILYRIYLPLIPNAYTGMLHPVSGDSLADADADQDTYSFIATPGTAITVTVDTVSLPTAFDIEAFLSTEDGSANCFAHGDDQMRCTYPPPLFACPQFTATCRRIPMASTTC